MPRTLGGPQPGDSGMIGRVGGILGTLAVLAVLAGAGFADAPARSMLPPDRPGPDQSVVATPGQGAAISLGAAVVPLAVAGGMATSPLPRRRPVLVDPLAAGAAAAAEAAVPALALASTSAAAIAEVSPPAAAEAAAAAGAGATSPLPKQRKGLFGFLTASATRTQPDPGAITGRAGSVCGIPGIKGKALPAIAARVKGCGLAEPVEVTSVDGIALTPPATIGCPTAVALNDWVHSAAKPAFVGKGGGLEALRVAASYICRTRNNVPGAPISEHSKGKAIDISGFILAGGAEVTVTHDYRRGAYSATLKRVHQAACGPFGTTLGPGSDGRHEDHIHMDIASYRSGDYCR